MSSTARFVQNAAARRTILNSHRLLSTSSRSAILRSPSHTSNLRSQTSALAILLPHRSYSTETSTHGGDQGNFPPPGFNAKEAQKPLPKEEQSKSASKVATPEDVRRDQEERSAPTAVDKTKAVEDHTLTELATEKAAKAKIEEAKAGKKDEKKLSIGKKVLKEIQHYWDGTKLLATEVRISSRLALKMAAGYELSRRENRQLQRTVQDLGRLVPFSVFVIVPFAELLLPVALRLFPNMLPSTYEGQSSKEAKATHLRNTRKNVSQFLRNTLKETGLPISAINAKKEEFTEFFRKVRATGEQPTHEDVIKVCKIFKDDLTLDNLSRPQLVGMCKYMNLNTFGTDAMLRYQIRHRMRQIKRDDKAISYEGVDSLSVPELQMACASRGLRTHGLSPAKLRDDLQTWLDLRLKFGVPSTLLVLSNAYMYTSPVGGREHEIDTQIGALQAVLSSIPEELFHEIELEVHNAEGAATNKQRLEVLKEQQELIEEENEQDQANEETGKEKVKDTENIDQDEKPKKVEAKAEAEAKDKEASAAERKEPQPSAEEKEALEAEADASEQGKEQQKSKGKQQE